MQFPTYADTQAPTSTVGEVYGLRTALLAGENYSDSTATDIFIHGRDYGCFEPASPGGHFRPDAGQFVRHYLLFADNTFSGTTWTGRTSFVSPNRLKRFLGSLVGYPYVLKVSSKNTLCRHLPEPFRQGSGVSGAGGLDWQYNDTRGATQAATPFKRFDFHCSGIQGINGISEGGQAYKDATAVWSTLTSSDIWSPSDPGTWNYPTEAYPCYEIVAVFDRLPYEITKQFPAYDPMNPTAGGDPAFGGEFSRFLLPQEDPNARALQVRGTVKWDANGAAYGQDGQLQPEQTITAAEGLPKLTGDNMLTWKWVDVPLDAYFWVPTKGATPGVDGKGIPTLFGSINNFKFPNPPGTGGDTKFAPFVIYDQETLLFRSAHRQQKGCFGGMPCWDITLYFQNSPASDGYGNWNRLLNQNGVFQRIKTTSLLNQNFYFNRDLGLIFVSADFW